VSDRWLFFLAGAAAMFGGGLRIATSFLTWDATDPLLELIALKVDLLALFGLMGIWLSQRAQLGWPGFLAFVVAESGIASIVGPDTTAFGIDTYQAGVGVIAVGLSALGLLMVIKGHLVNRFAGICWIGSLAAGLGGSLLGMPVEGFTVGGVLYGAGFVLGGLGLV
jgi:hypothetical protein